MRVEIACTLRSRLSGLAHREGFGGVLLLVPCSDVHTWTMRAPIDVAFVARDGTVVQVLRKVMPLRRVRNRQAVATLERFASDEPWFLEGDRIDIARIQEKGLP